MRISDWSSDVCSSDLIQRAFGRYNASPYPSNRANPMFDPPRAETLARRFGWSVDPEERGSVGRPVCIEVYPHPAMVSLFGLSSVLPYKSGRGRTPERSEERRGGKGCVSPVRSR